jgi:hypothetical protein
VALAAAATTKTGHGIALAVQHFLLFYAGVFALVALTASVGAGLAAADRVIMTPGGRIAAQAAHRAASFAAVVFLAVHITVEVLAGRSRAADAVVPFLDHGRTFYLGLGTVASDLLVLIVVTGLLRGRFAAIRPAWLWRALHAVAYLCWPLAIVHGLLAGRTAKPYVDWSYGACAAAVGLALVFRLAAGPRAGEIAAGSVDTAPAGIPAPAVPPAAAPVPGTAIPGAGLPGAGGPGPGFVPGAAGAWGRRALPAPDGAARPAPDGLAPGRSGSEPGYPDPSWPAPGYPAPGRPAAPGRPGSEPGYPDPGHPGSGYPDSAYPGSGYPDPAYPGSGYPDPAYPGSAYPGSGWSGHDEPAPAPCPGDGGR